ncbi:hypothetical protein SAMN05421675_0818 [Pasteurella multocida]|uniref:hypothetical protein n=1 Tax=Pasteurella multocida TaxID=747 RepID=UPI0008ED5589|nr:hypothetical protein [Pasteurella multocida]MDY0488241.1 hypothetical protein [Pasteurella multocida]MDY0594771.1 hypothetical protein [Pasteurella multocida]MDY0632050.1 hypothetical protein [Pasteurella multocida]MDY0664423.1 hypothetical protein [Pasteurella multocida]MDY0666364.1 hypothetical protein [Pasteurella multocida]
MEQQLIELGIKLSEALAKNTASAIFTKVKAIKAKKDDKETINELEEIIQELISDKNELLQISQAYQQELTAQKITDTEIEYITQKLIPKLQELSIATGHNIDAVRIFSPIISKETLTILQLLGFNFRKAIGEPLTILLEKMILSKLPIDPTVQAEFQLELLKVAKDPAARKTLEKWK